jgi:hypothetical protein
MLAKHACCLLTPSSYTSYMKNNFFYYHNYIRLKPMSKDMSHLIIYHDVGWITSGQPLYMVMVVMTLCQF